MESLLPDRTVHAPIVADADDIEIHAISWHVADVDANDLDDDEDDDAQEEVTRQPRRLVVKAFGVDEHGRSIAVTMTGFKPFFYLMLPGKNALGNKRLVERKLKEVSDDWMPAPKITEVRLKNFYGFQNEKKEIFYRISCDGIGHMRRLVNLIKRSPHAPKLFESNVDAVIRMCHLRNLRPCGWLRVPAGKYRFNTCALPSHCQYDAVVD